MAALKANKACVPCRVRKVKCDAAAVGLPCSSCTSRQCTKDCILPVRKGRTRRAIHVVPNYIREATGNLATEQRNRLDNLPEVIPANQSKQPTIADSVDCEGSRQNEPDLLCLHILNDAVKEGTESGRLHTTSDHHYPSRLEDSLTPRNCLQIKLPHLDELDNEYLVKKGVFDLPPPRYLDALIQTYFDHVHPFAPVVNRADFIRGYQSGNCSLFLLRAILTLATLHAPEDMLSGCGLTSRSAAQHSFFIKAKLLHDFAAEDDPLVMLQGSVMLSLVILDHPTDRDFLYWFHNAIRLATKLDIRNTCVREDKPSKVLKLCRRIWWALYTLDIFHVFLNTRRSRLLEDTPAIKVRTEDDWEAEDVPESTSGLLSAVTPQQKALPVVQCELARIFGHCWSIVTNKCQQDPRHMLHPLDSWRKSLAAKMHVGGNTGTDVYYLNTQAMSYRIECILCRLIRRRWHNSQHTDWSDWATQRLRAAILELDTIAMRVLASGTFQDFPITFATTIAALLALHIESALDPAEPDLVRSMARISISQTMLVLAQGREIPALKRALPIFEEIITKRNLYLLPPSSLSQAPTQPQSQDSSMADASASPLAEVNVVASQSEQCENNMSFDVDFLGFDFLDEWQIGQMDLAGRF